MEPAVARARRLTLLAAILGSSMTFVDATVVNVALPTIERDFRLGLAGEQWVVLAYSLALAALYLLGGAIGDRVGRRRAFVVGTVGFAAASALAGAAPGAGVLIGARALQGVFGALLTPGSLALLRSTFGAESGRAIGLWSAWTGISTVAGPLLGGALVQWVSWRWIFFLNLPLAGATVALALAGRTEERSVEPARPLDLPGAALAAVGFGALTYALVSGPQRGFGSAGVVATLAASAAALALFGLVEARAAEPMLPFALFRRRAFAVSNLETLLVYAALGASLFYLVLFLQSQGYPPLETGLLTAPISVILLLLASRFGSLADRRGPRLPLTVGPALVGAGILLFLLIGANSSWERVLPGVVVLGLGLSMTVAPITATPLQAAPGRLSGVAAGVNTTLSRLGSLLAIALVGLVVSLVFHGRAGRPGAVPLGKGQRSPALRSASAAAFHAGMLLAGGLALAGATAGGLGLRDERARHELAE